MKAAVPIYWKKGNYLILPFVLLAGRHMHSFISVARTLGTGMASKLILKRSVIYIEENQKYMFYSIQKKMTS